MANRVLRRPMFRMGGSPNFEFQEQTSGVLSGLDGPKLNASRTGLKEGGNPNKDIIFPTMEQQMINMGLGAGGGRDMSGIESLGIVEKIISLFGLPPSLRPVLDAFSFGPSSPDKTPEVCS